MHEHGLLTWMVSSCELHASCQFGILELFFFGGCGTFSPHTDACEDLISPEQYAHDF